MNISLFGNFTIEAAVRFQSDKIRALFAYVATHAGQIILRNQLAPLLWGGYPDKAARASVRNSLSRLKKAMAPIVIHYGDELLQITRATVQLNPVEGIEIDVHRFDQLWTHCEQVDRALWAERGQVIHALTELVQLYQGPFLDGFVLDDSMEFDAWVTIQRERTHQHVLIALETLVEHHLGRGNWIAAQKYAERQITLEPWHEVAHRQLIQIHHRAGRRDAALAQYERCQMILREELGAEPSQPTVALFEAIRDERIAPTQTTIPRFSITSASSSSVPHNLPTQLTPLVGRESELTRLQQLLASRSYRLISLLGHGGIGKTRLALALAESQLRFFTQGVYFVPLTSVEQSSRIVNAIVDTLGIRLLGKREPLVQLGDYLRERELLLVLDNLEHLLEDEATVNILLSLLEAAPQLVLLVTSRNRVWVRAETVVELSGLTYPKEGVSGQLLTDLQSYDAIRLFVERMQRSIVDYDPTPDLPTITKICYLVEGSPLGLELAATQSSMMSCDAVAEALENCLGSLVTRMRDRPHRQRSLQAVFDYSWCLLTESEQALLAQLSIFRGGFDWEMARQVVPTVTEQTLKKLIGHSLLRQQTSGRYDLQEMVRQFAAEQLDEQVQTALEQRYVHVYLAYLAAQEAELEGREPHLAVAKLLPDFDNLQHAWQRASIIGAFESIQHAIQALSNFLQLRGQHYLGYDLFQSVISFSERCTNIESRRFLPHLQAEAARFLIRLSKFNEATELANRAIELASSLNDFWAVGNASNVSAEAWWRIGKYSQAQVQLDKYKDAIFQSNSQRLRGSYHYNLAITYKASTAYEEARKHLKLALSIWEQIHHIRFEAITYNEFGVIEESTSQYHLANTYYQKARNLHESIDNHSEVAQSHVNLAVVRIATSQYELAIDLTTQALDYYQLSGNSAKIGWAMNNLGYCYYLLQNYEIARFYLEPALKHSQQCGEQRLAIYVLGNLGDVAIGQEHYGEAISYFDQAISTSKQYDGFFDVIQLIERRRIAEKKVGTAHNRCTVPTLATS